MSRAKAVAIVNKVIETLDSTFTENTDLSLDNISIRVEASLKNKSELLKILHQFKYCFESSLSKLGCTNLTQLQIELKNKQPVGYRPYRLSHNEREKVRSMVEEMLEAGIIRESISEYSSPIILIKKKDGGMRMCIDYHMLNSVTALRKKLDIIDQKNVCSYQGNCLYAHIVL